MSAEPAGMARNTSMFTLALVAQKVISFSYFTFLTRILGPAGMGKYVFAVSLTTIFSVLLDLGLANVLTREVARRPEAAERYVRLIMGFKLLAMSLVAALAVVYVWIMGYPVLTRELVFMACFVMVLDSFTLTAYSTIRGFHTLTWESIGTILMQAVVAIAGVTASFFTRDLRVFMAALILAALSNALYSLWQLRKRFTMRLVPIVEWQGWRELAGLAWPFAIAAILTRVYGYIDTVLLSLLSGDKAVGMYSVAYKVTFALQFIPSAFSATLFPAFSSYFRTEPEKLAATFMRGVVYLFAIAVPVSLGIIALAPEIIHTVYPAFAESTVPLQVLVFSLMFLFISFPVGALLPACNRQPRHTLNIGIAAAVNVILNLVLIPRLGPTGAAVASLISTLILLGLGWQVVQGLVALDKAWLSRRLAGVVAAGLLMFASVFWLKGQWHFLLSIPMGAVVYAILVVALGGITYAELKDLSAVFMRRKRIPVA